MTFVAFMRSWAGRLLRIAAGAFLIWYGTTQMVGTGGLILAAVGVVPIAAGVFNFCLIGPLFGLTLMGRRSASRP
jgi:hypothetical protein